jgi:hypothetical protein
MLITGIEPAVIGRDKEQRRITFPLLDKASWLGDPIGIDAPASKDVCTDPILDSLQALSLLDTTT